MSTKWPVSSRVLLALICMVILGVGAYWIKCQYEINLFKSFHLREILPVESLEKYQRTVTRNSYAAGSVIDNDEFSGVLTVSGWSRLWSREAGMAKNSFVNEGPDGSKCLRVDSSSEQNWVYWRNTLIETRAGDRFEIEGEIRAEQGDLAKIAVALYSADREVLQWSHGNLQATPGAGWYRYRDVFVVPDGVRYLRLRLSGSRPGSFWFDNIGLRCLKKS